LTPLVNDFGDMHVVYARPSPAQRWVWGVHTSVFYPSSIKDLWSDSYRCR